MVCRAFGILRSSYYRHHCVKKRVNHNRLLLKAHVIKAFKQSRGALGSRGIRDTLRNQSIGIGRYLVRKLMQEAGLISKQLKAHRYKKLESEHLDIPNVLSREFKPTEPNKVWTGDITYIWTGKGWSYLAIVLDLYARRVVGWSFSERPDKELVIRALDEAWHRRGKPSGVIFHSDQGSQYNSILFRQKLDLYQIDQSMSRKGNCWDNAPTERLFRSLKTEWIPRLGYHSIIEAKMDIGLYLMNYYNQIRPHQFNGGISPEAAENKLKTVSSIC